MMNYLKSAEQIGMKIDYLFHDIKELCNCDEIEQLLDKVWKCFKALNMLARMQELTDYSKNKEDRLKQLRKVYKELIKEVL